MLDERFSKLVKVWSKPTVIMRDDDVGPVVRYLQTACVSNFTLLFQQVLLVSPLCFFPFYDNYSQLIKNSVNFFLKISQKVIMRGRIYLFVLLGGV